MYVKLGAPLLRFGPQSCAILLKCLLGSINSQLLRIAIYSSQPINSLERSEDILRDFNQPFSEEKSFDSGFEKK